MRQATQTQSVEKLDPVWDRIREEAEEIARHEPALGGFIFSLVLNHDSFEEALNHRLAQRLGNADIGADLIVHAFNDAIEAEPEIGHAARADIIATFDRDPACHRYIDPLLYFKGYQAIQTHRFANALWLAGRKDFALHLQSRSSQVFQVDINPACRVGKGIMLDHATGFIAGETAVIGDNCSILQGVTLGGTGKADEDRHPKIGNGVLIGAGAKVLGNIKIGDCARIGAGSVVVKDVPARVTVVGVPAREVGGAGAAQPAATMDQMLDTTG
jgi:serine O-acetyltransferase